MSRPTDPTRYPSVFRRTVESLAGLSDITDVIRIPCTDVREAKNFQLSFNSFKKAALEAGWKTKYPELEVALVRIRKDGSSVWLEVSNYEGDPGMMKWEKALNDHDAKQKQKGNSVLQTTGSAGSQTSQS